MSFSFGQTTTTASGTAFSTNTITAGSLFGGGDNKTFQSPSGDNKTNLFASPTTSSQPFGGFSFGPKTTAATSNLFASSTTTTSSPFGATKPLSFGGFSAPPNQTVGSPGFGQAPPNQTVGGSAFGQTAPNQTVGSSAFGQATTTQNAPQNLSFGQTQPQTAAQAFANAGGPFSGSAGPGFSFAKTTANSGFSFTPTFTMPSSQPATTAQTTQANFTLTSTPSFAQSTPAFSQMFAKPGFTATTSAAAVTTTAAAAPSFVTTSSNLSLQQPSFLPQPTTANATSAGFSFSQTPATTFPTSQPQASKPLTFSTPTTQATSLSFTMPSSQASQVTQAVSQATPVTTEAPLSFNVTSQATTVATTSLGFAPTISSSMAFIGTAPTSVSLSLAKTTATTSATATPASTGILSLGKTTTSTTMTALTTATTTTASGPPQPVTSISFAQLEENINKWTLELEEQEKIFINQATQINAWDRLLIANGDMIVELNDTIQSVKNEQQSLEHELDFVVAQQRELQEMLAPLERGLADTGLRDPERDHMYTLAENLDTQLRQMSEDLKEVIEHLNETNRSQDTNDPIVQIGRILNAHMSSMQWIDNSIAQISTKLDQLKVTHDTLRRDNERSFQLTYN
ncbi:PREDICTED: nuclear pore glycoprotein p62 [Papilio polytes]|uniref:nuclear pore glycoprotein p62 n=1 Tax=Papilio polytes TaxID=76194 RepID=UPI0006769F8E|nr:PREDICTED: nuclear pore glycoprotein p62 [Papilio polytes]